LNQVKQFGGKMSQAREKVTLNDGFARAVKPPTDRVEVRHRDNGLILRVFRDGAKIWAMSTVSRNGKPTLFNLGSIDELTMKQARALIATHSKVAERTGLSPAQLKAADRESRKPPPAVVTVQSVVNLWLEDAGKFNDHVWANETARKYRGAIRPLTDRHGKDPIKSLRPADLLAVVKHHRDHGAGRATLKDLEAALRVLFRYAVNLGIVSENIARDLPRTKRPKNREYVIPRESHDALIEHLKTSNDPGAPFLLLCALVGCRSGEAFRIQRDQIDDHVWRVPDNKQRDPHFKYVLNQEQRQAALTAAASSLTSRSRLHYAEKLFNSLRDRFQLPPKGQGAFHSLRRTYVTREIENGTNPFTVSKRLHKSFTTTFGYFNPDERALMMEKR
jgi:integrase